VYVNNTPPLKITSAASLAIACTYINYMEYMHVLQTHTRNNIHYRKWGFVDVTYRSSFQFTKVGFNFSKRIKALVMRKLAFPSELALKRKYSVKYVRRNDDDIIMI